MRDGSEKSEPSVLQIVGSNAKLRLAPSGEAVLSRMPDFLRRSSVCLASRDQSGSV